MKKILQISLLLICCLGTAFAANEDKLYQVDLIVFTHITKPALQSEYWPNVLLKPNLTNAIELNQVKEKTINTSPDDNSNNQSAINSLYVLLPDNMLGLTKKIDKLQNDKGYQVILHISWQQPIGNPKQAKWIHIYGGQAYDETGQPIQPAQPEDQTEQQIPQPTPAFWQLNGKIKIGKIKFFDIYTQFYLTMPQSTVGKEVDTKPAGNFQPVPLQTFKLIQHQRTRANKLNYLDHPLFGALIKISPV
jgi:hypothetical protein